MDLQPLERAQANAARPVSGVIPRVLEDLRLDQRRAETEILRVWNRLLDPDLAAHAQPVGLRAGTLFVAVDSNVWLAEIVRYRRHEILDRLHSAFGRERVQRLSFRIQ